MIRLDSTVRSLQVLLAGAITTNQLPVTVCYSDKTATTYNGGTINSITNGVTPVTICAAPAASTIRDIDYINIYNADTASATVIIRYNDNGTFYVHRDITLQVDDTITYTHASGWVVTSKAGSSIQVTSVFGRAGAVTAQVADYLSFYLGKPSLVFTVGPQNCQYTTIQSALTANPTANASFIVYDGTYANDTINFTANSQCVIGMGSPNQQIVTQASSTICNIGAFTNCRLSNMTLTITAATSAVSCITASTGTAELSEVDLNVTNLSCTTAAQPSLINITSTGTIGAEFGDFTYTNNISDGTGATAVKAAFLMGNGLIEIEGIDLIMSCSLQSLGSTVAYTAGSGSITFLGTNELTVTDTGGTYVLGYFSSGAGTLTELAYTDWTITGGGANICAGIYLSGSATIKSHHNDYVITGGATNYSVIVNAGCTVNSGLDIFQAASGKTGAGAFNYVISDAAGNFSSSGLINISSATAGQIQFPATQNPSANANTLDDYKEGTWVPTYSGSTGGTPTVTTNSARYTKIGNRVLMTLDCTITNISTATGYFQFTLPIAASANSGCIGGGAETAVTGLWCRCSAGASATIATIIRYDNSVMLTNNYRFLMTMDYEV